MSTSTITPYLFFAGRCDEAINFYRDTLGAQVDMIMRFNESPDPVPAGMLQAGFENKVMHASFRVGASTMIASDGCGDKSKFDGFRIALAVATEAEAHHAFNALAEDGTIDMPLCKTFWSPCYGMVTDKFNVGWMVMVPGPSGQPQQTERELADKIATMSEDEATIRRMMTAWSRSLESKDVDGLVLITPLTPCCMMQSRPTRLSDVMPFVRYGPTACRIFPINSSPNTATSWCMLPETRASCIVFIILFQLRPTTRVAKPGCE